LLGGFFLYASYYGTDQSQVQRLFSAKDLPTVRKALLCNGLMRFPITLVYCVMGLIIGTMVITMPEFRSLIPLDKPDLMIPIFIREYLPHGIIGILLVAIFSAAMSSLSSTINSLSAATVEDFFNRKKALSQETYMKYSKIASIFWGLACLTLAFFTGDIADTVIEAINKIGSVFYGPILATFIAAIGLKRTNFYGANAGLIAGVLVNVYLWLFCPQVFWFWWNAIGTVITLLVCVVVSAIMKSDKKELHLSDIDITIDKSKVFILVLFTMTIIWISYMLPSLFS
jgi:Na+/proline symporter